MISSTIQMRSKRIVGAVDGSNSMHFEVSTSTLYSDHYYYLLLLPLLLLPLLLFNSFANPKQLKHALGVSQKSNEYLVPVDYTVDSDLSTMYTSINEHTSQYGPSVRRVSIRRVKRIIAR